MMGAPTTRSSVVSLQSVNKNSAIDRARAAEFRMDDCYLFAPSVSSLRLCANDQVSRKGAKDKHKAQRVELTER